MHRKSKLVVSAMGICILGALLVAYQVRDRIPHYPNMINRQLYDHGETLNTMFHTRDSPDHVIRFYATTLPASRWILIREEFDAWGGGRSQVYQRDKRGILIDAGPAMQQGSTIVSVEEGPIEVMQDR